MAVGSSAASPAKLTDGEVIGPTEVADRAEVVGPTEVAASAEVVVGGAEVLEVTKYCHQCHQRTAGAFAACKKQKKGKFCSTKFCHKCLRNRYGEEVGEVTALENWFCPKCRGICNCCMCRKKKIPNLPGKVPTAEASGSSVTDLLGAEGPQNLDVDSSIRGLSVDLKDDVASNNPVNVLLEGQRLESSSTSNQDKKKRKRVKGGIITGMQDGRCVSETRKKKLRNSHPEIVLPQGTELTSIAGISLTPEDIGHVLQFMEFCASFGEILRLKEGEPEWILRELAQGGLKCRGKFSLSVHLHKLLLQEDLEENSSVTPETGKNSWLDELWRFSSRYSYIQHTLDLKKFSGEDGYDGLNFSQKLRLLNFLCDEFLSTRKIRSWMDEKLKKEQENVLSARSKDKRKIDDEFAKAVDDGATGSETKLEAAEAIGEMPRSKGIKPNVKQRLNVLRREPIHLGFNGRICWRLKWCADDSNLFIEEMGSSDGRTEKWFIYNNEEEKEMESYLLSVRKHKKSRKVVVDDLSNNTWSQKPILDPLPNSEL